jgi:uncharacterized protein (DUF305 family)
MRRNVALAAGLLLMAAAPARADHIQFGPSPDEEHLTGPMPSYEFRTGSGEGARADLAFARGMRRHHQGAVDMARIYLADARGTNPILRKLAAGIIQNQRFEIAMLDEVAGTIERSGMGSGLQPSGRQGADYSRNFIRAPQPGTLDRIGWDGRVSDYDVQFAKSMIDHHQMALDMGRRFNADPRTSNRVLKEMNIELVVDQGYEINLLQSLVGRYPGDAQAVKPDPELHRAMMASMPDQGSAQGKAHGH